MPLADFNTPHDLCLKKYPVGRRTSSPLKRHFNHKKENNENERVNDFGGSTSSLDDAERQTPEPNQLVSTGDRLVQLIVKGVLYENCVNYCEQVATSNTDSTAFRAHRTADAGGKDHGDANDEDDEEKASMSSLETGKPALGSKVSLQRQPVDFSNILSAADSGKADLKLLNWLTSLPKESFNYYFDSDSPLPLKIEQCEKPALAANWSEAITATPIKPKVFPPFGGTPFAKLPPIVGNGPASTLNNSAAPSNNSLQLHPAGQPLSLANSNQQAGQQLASLLSNLGADGPAATGDQLGSLLSLINQMSQGGGQPNGFSAPQVPNSQNSAKGAPANFSDLKQLYQSLLIEDLAKAPAIGARDRGMAEPNENGVPKLDFLAQNFSQLTSLNDLSGSSLFGLTNGNGLNGGHPASPHHGPPPTDSLLASLSKSQLNSLLQSANLSGLLNGNALADLGPSLNGQLDEGAPSLMMNAKLAAKVPKELWMKKQSAKKSHLFVVNDGNKMNHSFVTNQSLFIDDDLCGKGSTGKRAKQYKKRDNPVSILFWFPFPFCFFVLHF